MKSLRETNNLEEALAEEAEEEEGTEEEAEVLFLDVYNQVAETLALIEEEAEEFLKIRVSSNADKDQREIFLETKW